MRPRSASLFLPAMAFSLSRKCLVIILVPLLLLVGFALALSHLLSESEQTAQQALACYDTEQICQSIESSWSVAQLLQMMYFEKEDEVTRRSIAECAANVPSLLEKLKSSVGNEDVHETERIVGLKNQFSNFPQTKPGSRQKQCSEQMRETARQGCILAQELKWLAEKQELKHEAVLVEQSALRQLLRQLMIAVVLFNIFLAVLLSLFFAASVTGRLQVVIDNTGRLSRGLPLRKPLSNTDEIGCLDLAFHEMAKALLTANKALAESEKHLCLLIAGMPVGLVTVDDKGLIESMNPRALEMFGYEEAAVSGLPFSALFPSVKEDCFESADEAAGSRLRQNLQVEGRSRQAEPLPAEISMSRLETLGARRVLVSVQDMSERQRLARQRQEFLNMVSHDLRTPLTSVGLSLDMLGSGVYGQLPEGLSADVACEESNIRRLVLLINDLLDLEKMESGKLEMHFAEISLGGVLNRALTQVNYEAGRRGVKIILPESDLEIEGDEERLVQLLGNLLLRAVMVSPEGSQVRIMLVASGARLEIRVADQGPFIAGEDRARLFDRFVARNKDAAYAGSALSLPICQAIARGHKGEIGVQSDEGGSTFWFHLPVCQGAAADNEGRAVRL